MNNKQARRPRKSDLSTPSQKKLREINRRIDVDRRKAILARTAAGRAAITAFIGKTKLNTALPVIVVVAKPPPPVEVVQPPPPIAPPVAFDIFEYEKNPPKRVLPPLAQKPSSVSRAPVRERVKVPMALPVVHLQDPPPIPVDAAHSKEPIRVTKSRPGLVAIAAPVDRAKKYKPPRTAIAAPVNRVTGDVLMDKGVTCAYCNALGHVHTNCPKKVELRKALTLGKFRARAASLPPSA